MDSGWWRGPCPVSRSVAGRLIGSHRPDWRRRACRNRRRPGERRSAGRNADDYRCGDEPLAHVVTSDEGAVRRSGAGAWFVCGARRTDRIPPAHSRRHSAPTGETLRLDLRLEVGGVTEAVTVTARRAAPSERDIRPRTGRGQQKVVDLPLNGRSFITLASLAPGVAPPPPASSLPRINGGRPRTNEYLFDGISVLQPEPGQVAFFPNIDAIQEFKIESNSPPAEFGRFNGGVVNLTTKAGTNAFHGTLFEFVRNEALNARNLFASGVDKPTFRRHQFGGVVGGPIRRDRTFFFADYQGQRQTIGRTVISTVPTRSSGRAFSASRSPDVYRSSTIPRQRRRRRPARLRASHFLATRFLPSHRSRRSGAPRPLSGTDDQRHDQQLPAPGRRDGRSGSVQRAHRPSC